MASSVAVACLLSCCVSALRFDPNVQELAEAQKPQYKPDHYPLFGGCASSNPKIAVIVAGRASGFVHPSHAQNFQEHVLNHLAEKGAKGLGERSKPDVFVHVKTGEGEVVASREQAGGHSVVSHQMCEEAAQDFSATSYVVEDGWGPKIELKKPECFKSHGLLSKAYSQAGYFHSIQDGFALMTDQEKKMSAEYDIIVFQRPDHGWRHDVEWAKLQVNESNTVPANFYGDAALSVSCQHGHIWGDQLMVLPRRSVQPFLTFYDDLALSEHPKICPSGGKKKTNNEAVFEITAKSLKQGGHNIDWTMARNAP
jgi:hypothetical protein